MLHEFIKEPTGKDLGDPKVAGETLRRSVEGTSGAARGEDGWDAFGDQMQFLGVLAVFCVLPVCLILFVLGETPWGFVESLWDEDGAAEGRLVVVFLIVPAGLAMLLGAIFYVKENWWPYRWRAAARRESDRSRQPQTRCRALPRRDARGRFVASRPTTEHRQ
ncbi:MAG: hypothetical protein ACYSVY_11765 [Planctomycetota bacterium]